MIKIDIQMPEKCGLCPCFHSDNPMYCQAVKADKIKKIVAPYGAPRPEWCPLKEQEEQIKNRDESLEKAREEIKWLRGMLKERNDNFDLYDTPIFGFHD